MADVNYGSKVKPYPMHKNPKKQKGWTKALIFPASWLELFKYRGKRSIDRIGMKGLKAPYLILVNHSQFLDFKVVAAAMFPHGLVNVASIDGFTISPWLLRQAGIIAKRKFNNANTMSVVRSVLKALKSKSIVALYPETQYSFHGAANELPDSLGKMIKMFKVPVVNFQLNGHYLNRPGWSNFTARKPAVPIHATIKQILTKEDVEKLSAEEIIKTVRKEFWWDDHAYQLEKGILIKDSTRAEGMHKLLYKCPDCKQDCKTFTKGAVLGCECGASWELLENGMLEKKSGKKDSRFETFLQWYNWQREEVRKEINMGKYRFEDENVEALGLPDGKKWVPLGKVKFVHSMEGFRVQGHYNNADFDMVWSPLETYRLQQEIGSAWCNKKDAVALSTENDTIFFIPTKPGITTKLVLATEELYKFAKEKADKKFKKKIKN